MKAVYKDIVLAETETYEMVEGNVYFPKESVKWELFSQSDTPYTCPWKGETQYYNLSVAGEVVTDGAWSYPDPKPAAKNIAGHVAFDRKVTVS